MSIVEYLSQPFWQRLGLTLVHFLWQGLAVAVLVGVFVRVLRLKHGNARYGAYLLAFIAMIACPVVTFTVIDIDISANTEPVTVAEQPEVVDSSPSPYTALPAGDILPEVEPSIPAKPALADSIPLGQRISGWLNVSMPWVLVIWMAGVAVLSLRLVMGFVGVYRWRHHLEPLPERLVQRIASLSEVLGMRRFSRVFISPTVLQAMAVGYLRPMVLLPAAMLTQMQPEMLEAVIAHELAHIRRFDLWVNLIQRITETLLFYHPAVWWLSNCIRSERELCCDELAVKATGERITYASTLESVGRARFMTKQPVLATGLGQDKKPTLGRVHHILGLKPAQRNCPFWLAGVITVLFLAALVIPTTLALTNQSDEKLNDLESVVVEGIGANRDKFKCGHLAWSSKHITTRFADSNRPATELAGEYELWWNGSKKIATKYVRDEVHKDPQGNFRIEKGQGGTSYDGGVLSWKPDFHSDNWLGPEVTRWRGLGSQDWLIRQKSKLDHVTKDWSVIDANGAKLIRCMSKNINETARDYGGYSIRDYDPSKGYGLVNEEWYNPNGSPRMKHTVKMLEVIPGGWFPVEVDFKSFAITDGTVYSRNHYALDIERCSFNDKSAFPAGIFKGAVDKQLKYQEKLQQYLAMELRGISDVKNAAKADKIKQGAREAIEKFVAAALAGDLEKAGEYAHPDELAVNQIADFNEIAKGQNLWIMAVVADDFDAIAVSSVIFGDHERIGPLVFFLDRKPQNERDNWWVHDIDMETPDSAEVELKQFLEKHPKSQKVLYENKPAVHVEGTGITAEKESEFSAILPNGVRVELIGMCEYPNVDKQWWRPNGSLLVNPPYDESNIDILSFRRPDAIPIEFAFRLSGNLSEPAWEAKVKGDEQAFVWWTGRRAKDGELRTDIKSIGMFVKSDQRTLDLRLGFSLADGPYEWADFKNISVKPNFKPDVEVEVEGKSGCVVQGKVHGPRGEPVNGATVELQIFVGGDVDDMANYRSQRVFTDVNGLYVFEGLDAGSAHIGRAFNAADGSTSGVPHGLMFDFEIEPGKSYDITLGGKGRPVAGRLVPASGNAGDIDWSKARAYFDLRAGPFSMGAWESSAKIVRAMINEEGGDFYSKSPVKINPDGTFRIDNVRAGLYMLRVKVIEEPKRDGFNLFRDVRIPLMRDGTTEKPLNLGTLAVSHGDYQAPRHIDNKFLGKFELGRDIPVILKAGNDEEPDVVSTKSIRFEKDGESVTAALNIEWKSIVADRWQATLKFRSENASTLARSDVFFKTSKIIERYAGLHSESLHFAPGLLTDLSKVKHFLLTIRPVREQLTAAVQKDRYARNSAEAIKQVEVEKPDVQVDRKKVWGKAVNGLRAAVEFVPEKESYSLGERVGIRFHIQNVSDHDIQIASTSWRQEERVFVQDEQGKEISVSCGWFTGLARIVRYNLKPRETVGLESSGLGFGDADSKKDINTQPLTSNFIRCGPGGYFVHYKLKLPDIISKDGEGKVIVPQPDDWQGVVETGNRKLVLTSESDLKTAVEIEVEKSQDKQDVPHPIASSDGNTLTGIDILVSEEKPARSPDTPRSYDLTSASDFVRKHFDGWKTEVRNNYLLKEHTIKEEHVLKGKTGAVAYVWFATTLENVQTKETKPFEAVYFLYRWHTDQWEGIFNTDGTNSRETEEVMEIYRNKWLPSYLKQVEQGYTRVGSSKTRTPPVQGVEKSTVAVEAEETILDKLVPTLKVLDSQTLKPISNCSFTFSGWGRVEKTNSSGIFNNPEKGFAGRLIGGDQLVLCHPDYDNKSTRGYTADKNGVVTVLLDKGGDASLEVKVSLTVRGKKSDHLPRVRLLNVDNKEVRRITSSHDSTYRFSGLAEGAYTIEAYFWDSYPTFYEKIQLSAGEHRNVSINAQTDEVARIRVAGRVINKKTYKGIEGLKIHFVGAPQDDALTNKDGAFSAMADRARFHQCSIYFERRKQVFDRRTLMQVRINNHIREDLAKKLSIHIDPNSLPIRPLRDDDGDGVFCDILDCKICAPTQNESDMPIEGESGWGEAVEGLAVRLRAKGATTGKRVTLLADARNDGPGTYSGTRSTHGCWLKVDGKWYGRVQTREFVAPMLLKAGDRQLAFTQIRLSSEKNHLWRGGFITRNGQVPSLGAREIHQSEPLELTPGRHTVRLAFPASRKAYAYSNSVEIEILPTEKKSAVQIEVEKTSQPQFSTTPPNGVTSEQPATIRVPEDYPTAYEAVKAAKAGDTLVISTDRYRGEDTLIEPKLEFLAWQTKKDSQPSVIWRADGDIVTDREELSFIRKTGPGPITSQWRSDRKYLHLWFSFPQFDNHSFGRVALYPLSGGRRLAMPTRFGSNVPKPVPEGDNRGWLQHRFSLFAKTKNSIPEVCNIELHYSSAKWKDIRIIESSDFESKMTLWEDMNFGTVGQTKSEHGFVSLVRNRDNEREYQYRFVAIKKDGTEIKPTNWGHMVLSRPPYQGWSEEYLFDVPLSEIDSFKFQTRPLKTVLFENVALKTSERGAVQVEAEEAIFDKKATTLKVLDSQTLKPISNCSFTFTGWGRVEKTNSFGIFNNPEEGFAGRLDWGRRLILWHPDYDNKITRGYKADRDGVVTVLLDKGGDASLEVKVSLTVRGKKSDHLPQVKLLNSDKHEVRRITSSHDSTYRFSGLAGGEYTIEASFFNSYPCFYEKIQLSAGEHRNVFIDAQTDQLARIRVIGRVINKKTNKGIEGLKIHFVGAPGDDARTNKDGAFSAMADRARFHQCLIMGKGGGAQVEMDNHIKEDLAKKLAIHIDPDSPPARRLRDDDGDGVFCDALDCKICATTQNESAVQVEGEPLDTHADNQRTAISAIIEQLKSAKYVHSGRGSADVAEVRTSSSYQSSTKSEKILEFRFEGDLSRSDAFTSEKGKRGDFECSWAAGPLSSVSYNNAYGSAMVQARPFSQFYRKLGYDFHPVTFPRMYQNSIVDLLQGMAKQPQVTLKVTQEPKDVVRVVSESKNETSEQKLFILLINDADGMRLSSWEFTAKDSTEYGAGARRSSLRLKWKKYAGVWYISEAISEDAGVHDGLRSEGRTTVTIRDFTPNVEIEDKEFTLDGLDIPPGAMVNDRILDTRYRYAGSKGDAADKLRKLSQAALMYANDYDNKFPDTIQQLRQFLDEKELKWLSENVCYLGKGKTVLDTPETPLAYDRTMYEAEEAKGTNVLFVSGIVSFRTREQLKKLGITSEPKPAVQVEGEGDWGEAVEGVQCRLRADKYRWEAEEKPVFKADIRNRGELELYVHAADEFCQLEIDGEWHGWTGPWGKIDVKQSRLGHGSQINEISISLAKTWVGKKSVLALTAGVHTVRVAFILQRSEREYQNVVRVVSNPVEIEVVSTKAKTAGQVEGEVATPEEFRKKAWKVFGLPPGVMDYLDSCVTVREEMNPDKLITVHCVDQEGQGISYCRVVFVDRGEQVRIIDNVATDEKGYAYCDDIDGPFSIMAQVFDYSPLTKAWRFQHKKIEKLYNANDKPVITVQFPPFPEGIGQIQGTIKDQSDHPLKEFDLVLTQREGENEGWGDCFTKQIKKHFIHPEGNFEIGNLAAETYTYYVYPKEQSAYVWDFNMGEVTVGTEDTVQLNIDIEANKAAVEVEGEGVKTEIQEVVKGFWKAVTAEDWQAVNEYSEIDILKQRAGALEHVLAGVGAERKGLLSRGINISQIDEVYVNGKEAIAIGPANGDRFQWYYLQKRADVWVIKLFDDAPPRLSVQDVFFKCRSVDKLMLMGERLAVYAAEHQGKLPDNFEALEPYIPDKSLRAWLRKHVEYLGKGKEMEKISNNMVAYTKTLVSKDENISVLFNDGNVGFVRFSQVELDK